MTGIAKLDGTLTGNRSDLRAAGTFVGDDLAYGEDGALGALALSSTYDVRVPHLDYARAQVSADTNATFVAVAGQHVNELTAKTTYADKEVIFDAVAKQPKRSLTASGAVALRPDVEEIRLRQLMIDTQGVQWQLAAGSPATIQYGPDAITAKDVKLVSGSQRLL